MTDKPSGTSQHQFLHVVDRDEAERRFRAALELAPRAEELVPLDECLGRVLARNVLAAVDVPSFDRSNLDGFAVRARDTAGATETEPRRLRLTGEIIATAVIPEHEVNGGMASPIATGAMLPRGADAVVMIEHTDIEEGDVVIRRAVAAGNGLSFAGSDIGAGETVLRRGDVLTSRETGVLAAIGVERVHVWQMPRVAILSTGDEIIAPGQSMRPGFVFDSNAQILADAVRELGGHPLRLGVVPDDVRQLRQRLHAALEQADVVLLSGGTSKGAGDLSYRVVSELTDPGIVSHGVALKPGKPLCLAVTQGKPVVILPGFPTSAVFTFHEFVAPVIRQLAGLPAESYDVVPARLAVKVNSEAGRTEYLLVGLVAGPRSATHEQKLAAYPMGKGSGSVTTFSRADGFVTIGRHEELLEAGADVSVRLLGRGLKLADLVIIGSHCVGVDCLIGHMQARGFHCKFLAVGSTAGLAAAQRGECDLAGIHLLDPRTRQYNLPFLTSELTLIPGYHRRQGILFRPGDARFENWGATQAIANALADRRCVMVNRNQGSGTRILIDGLLAGAQPDGYASQPRSHNAVATAIVQHRADWGVAIERVALQAGLSFLPLADETFDFVVRRDRQSSPAVAEWMRLLADDAIRQQLKELGLRPYEQS
jgi:putative molybdopterin biosynthesis protein